MFSFLASLDDTITKTLEQTEQFEVASKSYTKRVQTPRDLVKVVTANNTLVS